MFFTTSYARISCAVVLQSERFAGDFAGPQLGIVPARTLLEATRSKVRQNLAFAFICNLGGTAITAAPRCLVESCDESAITGR